MNMIENKQGITNICFKREIQVFCPLGSDFYTAIITVELCPDKYFMDYCETDEFIIGLSGKSMIIEELVSEVFDHVNKYEPNYLSVTVEAKSNKHFPVTVTKKK